MATTHSPLAAQRLLLAGLAALALFSAFLLALLRGGAERRRDAEPEPELASPARATPTLPAAASAAGGATGADPERPHERTELTSTPAPPAAEETAFDPGAITGQLLCESAPVADVELRLFDGELERRERRTPLATTKSDAHGRFRVSGFRPHLRYALQAQHPDYLPEDEIVFPGRDEELELETAATVAGTTRALASGEPIAGVEVALERWHFAAGGMRPAVSATSDADGRWRLTWARPGIERFRVLRPGFLPEQHEFQVGAEGGEGYTILLGEARVVELELYALETGAPLADTELACDQLRVRTDARGRLAFPIRPEGDPTLRVTLALDGGCRTEGLVDIESLGGAGTPLVRVPLARGCAARGRVVDAGGAPVSGAQLRLSGGRTPTGPAIPPGFWLSPPHGTVRSGADGSFELLGLPPRDGPVQVRARHPDHPPGRSEPFALTRMGAVVELEIRLELGATLTGRVLLDGEPAGLRVVWAGEHASGWTRANDRGAYRVTGVPSGPVRLGARLEGEDDDFERPEDLLVFAEEGATLTADLELVSNLAHIRGRVIDTLGQPVAEAEVVAHPKREESEDWQEDPNTESEPDGSFELAVPDEPGLAFEVVAVEGPRRARAESVFAGGRELELVLPALATVLLRVVDALQHEPVPSFRLYWRDADEGSFERLSQGGRKLSPGPDGSFLAELPAGRLDLLVCARDLGYVPARRDGVHLFGDGTPEIELELERGVDLELQFEVAPEAAEAFSQLRRAKTGIASLEQLAERERGGTYFYQEVRDAQAVRPDGKGIARVETVPSGRYCFFNGPKGVVFRPLEFEVPPVAQHRVKVVIEPEPKKRKNPAVGGNQRQ